MVCRINKLINRSVPSLDAAVDIRRAASFMAEKDVASVLVTREGKVIGLFTENDMVRRVIASGKAPEAVTLGDVCSRKLISVYEDTTCSDALKTMNYNHCRRLLVYRGETLKGLVTLRSIAREMDNTQGRADTLLNLLGGATVAATLLVIVLGLYQLPQMARIATAMLQ